MVREFSFAVSSRRDSTCVRPGGGRVSGNLHVHTLYSYPQVNLKAETAKPRGARPTERRLAQIDRERMPRSAGG